MRAPSPWLGLVLIGLAIAGCSNGGDGDPDVSGQTVVETIAGGNIGDGRPATAAPLAAVDVAVDRRGNVLLSDHGRVRRVDAGSGTITTVLREGPAEGCLGEPPAGAGCSLAARGIAVDERGDLLVSDGANDRLLRLDLDQGTVTTVLGCKGESCVFARADEDTPARATYVSYPSTIAVGEGKVFVTESDQGRVLRIDESGNVRVVAGTGDTESGGADCPDGVPATETCIRYGGGLAVDAAGGLLIAGGSGFAVRRVDPATGMMQSFVGLRPDCDAAFRGDGGPATTSCLQSPVDVVVGGRGDLFISDPGDLRIRRVDGQSGVISTLIQGTAEEPLRAIDLTVGPDGDLFALVWGVPTLGEGNRVLRIDPVNGSARVVAGNGTRDYCGDGGPAKDACFGDAHDLAVAPDGAVLVSEPGRIRRIDPRRETVSTIAGGVPVAADSPTLCPDGIAASTCLHDPVRLAVDAAGNVFILEWHYAANPTAPRIRRLDARSGAITTIAGGCESGLEIVQPVEGTAALGACIFPSDLAVDGAGHVFFSVESGIWTIDEDGRLRLVGEPANPVTCEAGGCFAPIDIAAAPDDMVYVLDWTGTRIRRIDLTTGKSTVVAGNGTDGQCGHGGPAVDACLLASHIVLDADGNLLVGGNGLVRRVDAATGIIDTIAGDPTRLTGPDQGIADDESAVSVMAVDALGRLLYLDGAGQTRIRRITLAEAR